MTFYSKSVFSLASLIALGACGGGGSGDGLVNGSLRAIDAGSVARALEDGKTLTADSNSVVSIDYLTDETELADADFGVRKTEDGNLAFSVNGKEYVFTDSDQEFPNGYRIEDGENDIYIGLNSYDGPITDDLNPNGRRYAQVFGWYTNQEREGEPRFELNGISVVGTQTDLAQLNLLDVVNYSGFMNLQFFEDSGYDNFENSRVRVRGDMELTADISSGTISGELADGDLRLQAVDAPDTFIGGSVLYEAGLIDGTSFGGAISVDPDFIANVGVGDVTGDYTGAFYGPLADETAGTITGTSDGGYNMQGQFNAIANRE